MANILEILLKLSKSGTGGKDTEKELSNVQKAAIGLNRVFAGLGLALGGQQLLQFGQDSVAAARESAAAEGELQAALTSSGQASAEYTTQLLNLATALENTSLFTDEQVISAEASLVTFKNLGQDIMPQAIATVVDMGQKMGDLGSAAQLAGIVLNNPAQAAARLQRQGILLTETQKEQIATMMQLGNTAGAQGVLLDALNTKFGGQAQAARDAAGSTADYAVSVGRLQEAMGGLLLTIGDAGATDAATGWIDRLAAGAGAWTSVIENVRLLSEANARLAEESGEVEIAQHGAMGQVAGSQEAYANAEGALASLIGWFVEGSTEQEGFAQAVQEVASATNSAATIIGNTPAKLHPAQLAVKAYADQIRDLTQAQLSNQAATQAGAFGGQQDTFTQNLNLTQLQQASDARLAAQAEKKAQEEEAAKESERLFKQSTQSMVKATSELGDQIASAVSGAVSQSSTDIAALLGITPEGEARVNEGVRRMAAVATGGLANEWTQGLAEQLKGVDAAQAFVNAVAGGNESAVKEEAQKLAINPIVELFDTMAMANGIEQKLRGQDLSGQLNARIQKILSEKGLDTSIEAISQVALGTQEVATQAGTSVAGIGTTATGAGEQVKASFDAPIASINFLILRIAELNKMLERTKVLTQEAGGAIGGLNPPVPGAGAGLVPNGAQRRMGGVGPL